jgi:THO complex subunit 1
MPSLLSEGHGISAVTTFSSFLDELLERAQSAKPTTSIEPALDKSVFQGILQGANNALPGNEVQKPGEGEDSRKLQRYAIVETAVRDAFADLIVSSQMVSKAHKAIPADNLQATTPIESPEFVRVWNLLDIVSILANVELCDPALIFGLVEELLDGQTIKGCRKVFEFLESRRERVTAKVQSQKLVVLRACNELLRRLSRAEDATFCGRIFIFMFQSFPLGDRSSVNLRGEYHVENVTAFDEQPQQPENRETMEVDGPRDDSSKHADPKVSKAVSFDGKGSESEEEPIDYNALYPAFWSLQASFSQPRRLFKQAALADLKTGLESTMKAFRSISQLQRARSSAEKDKAEKQAEEPNLSLKRKLQDDDEDEEAIGFNPKYLTSRDLFELEVCHLGTCLAESQG